MLQIQIYKGNNLLILRGSVALGVDGSNGVYFDSVSVSSIDKKELINDYSKKRDWDKCLIDIS